VIGPGFALLCLDMDLRVSAVLTLVFLAWCVVLWFMERE